MDESKVNVKFLGVGSATQESLGHASAVVEYQAKYLLIDCGPGTIKAFVRRYSCLPDALFVTHCHLDHIGDLEYLFIQSWFNNPEKKTVKVFAPATIIPLLHTRIASFPNVVAEGGVNFWDAFHLVPVVDHFHWNDLVLDVPEVRHHSPKLAFGLCLRDVFFYSGDTRPIPEVLSHYASKGVIFHDCGLVGNPSHTGIDDVLREYSAEIIERCYFYHYTLERDTKVFKENGLKVVTEKDVFSFDVR